MGLFGKIFGGKSAADHAARGDELLDQDDPGGAKLAYEKALDKADTDAERETYRAKIDEARDGIALRRLDEAERLLEQGDLDLAREELAGALEVAVGDEAREEIQDRIDSLERDDAIAAATTSEEIGDEDKWAVIVGRWEDAQAEELDQYGDALRDALLLLHDGKAEEAAELLEALLDEADAPRFLWGEVARARLATGDDAGGREALEELVDSIAVEEIGEVWLGAQITLASLADEADDFEEAMERYQKAVEVFDDDHRSFFAMGRFLRTKDLPEEAIEVLEAASGLLDDIRPDWQVLEELGLAYADAEREDEAIATLERVIAFFTDRKLVDFPIRTARTLAELHEEQGKLERAADLYASLARGSDRQNHAEYHREAGRLLGEVGLTDEARRMLKRAIALADEGSEDREEAEALLADLDD
ncbi:MAG: tetratricopeptide repeat protein [Deltaproteobacteria bacterium]|nr:tetratricopeptide repeat protein [Deltaproteobacteria bacterium]